MNPYHATPSAPKRSTTITALISANRSNAAPPSPSTPPNVSASPAIPRTCSRSSSASSNATSTATGVALAEVYEDDNQSSRLINLSARTFVGTAAAVSIPGIVVRGGTAPKKLLIRGVGPGLTAFGVNGALANPTLTVTNAAGAIFATSDDWETNANLADLRAATTALSAFTLTPSSKDAALLVTLPAGNYTAQVSGVANTTGVALVEVYEVP